MRGASRGAQSGRMLTVEPERLKFCRLGLTPVRVGTKLDTARLNYRSRFPVQIKYDQYKEH